MDRLSDITEIQDAVVYDIPLLIDELNTISTPITDHYIRELAAAIIRDGMLQFPEFENTQLFKLSLFLNYLLYKKNPA